MAQKYSDMYTQNVLSCMKQNSSSLVNFGKAIKYINCHLNSSDRRLPLLIMRLVMKKFGLLIKSGMFLSGGFQVGNDR